jgi:hypothetical protein
MIRRSAASSGPGPLLTLSRSPLRPLRKSGSLGMFREVA